MRRSVVASGIVPSTPVRMLANVLHPAVLIHVPLRGRNRRLSLVAMRTPVDLPDYPASDMECLDARRPFANEPPPLHRSADGLLWRRMEWQDGKPVTDVDLMGYLEDAPGRRGNLHRHFRGTPVAAWGLAEGREVAEPNGVAPRGSDVDADASRSIDRDDRPRAAADLVRHLSERVRLSGGVAWHRVTQTLVFHDCGSQNDGRVWVGEDERIRDFRSMHAAPSDLALAFAHKGFPMPREPKAIAGFDAAIARDPAETGGHHARAAFLNGAAGMTRAVLDTCLSRLRDDARSRPALAALREQVRMLELDALTGRCGADGQLAPLRLIEDAMRVVVRFDLAWQHKVVCRDLEGFYVPSARLAASRPVDIPQEDIAGLSEVAGIAP